jgi:hypothetical protein
MAKDLKKEVSDGIKNLADVLRQTADAYDKLADDLTDPGQTESAPAKDEPAALAGMTFEERARWNENQ